MKPRMLDLFCGRWGWSKAFAERGWDCVGIDLVAPPEVPQGCLFIQADITRLHYAEEYGWYISLHGRVPSRYLRKFDFICASSPCEQFSVHGMKHFHPDPPYPELGIKLFEHTRAECERSGTPYVMENVRPAQKFVGNAVDHCGPFYLWGNGLPALLPRHKITKGIDVGSSKLVKTMTIEQRREYRAQFVWNQAWSSSTKRKRDTAKAAEIPLELSTAVCNYAENLLAIRAA